VQGDRLEDWYIEDGSRSADVFVSFLHVPDGSLIGWWRPRGEALDAAPLVYLGSEGEHRALAWTPATFLSNLARGATAIYDLDETTEPNERAALRSWLASRGAWIEPEGDDVRLREAGEKVTAWFNGRSEERRKLAQDSAERNAASRLLQSILELPPRDEPWRSAFADLIITGTQCNLFPNMVGVNPLPVSNELEAALRRLRDRDASELPDAGLWFRAELKLDADGVLMLGREYLSEPRDGIVLDDEGLRRDHMRMRRSPYWMPEWLAQRISA
jgi:hypothetical protein